jgi:hypothetical protein
MADSPGAALGSLLVHPGAVAAAAAPVHAIGLVVLRSLSALPAGGGTSAVGEPTCADNLLSTSQLIVEAMKVSADALSKLSEALAEAAVTYRFADSSALAGWSW